MIIAAMIYVNNWKIYYALKMEEAASETSRNNSAGSRVENNSNY